MAFFQFRRSREEQAAKLAPAQTVEAMRKRAMHRLIGSAVLVLAGVIGFPLVFDNQPRPIPVDLPIEIADKAKVKPLVAPPPAAMAATTASEIVVGATADQDSAAPVVTAAPDTAAAAAPVPAPLPAPVAPVTAKVVAPSVEKPAVEKPVAKASDANKAQALLEGKPASSTAAVEGRFVVQVGAFADAAKVREVRQKVERVGLKTYTQVVETKDGSKTITFDNAIIAAGSSVVRIPGFPYDDTRLIDSTGALALADVPKRMLIIGGGIIGLEMATVYDALGSKITVVELADGLIPGADRDLVRPLHKRIEQRYEAIYLKTKVTKIEAKKEGLKVTFEGENAPAAQLFDRVLLAVGRRPNGREINAEDARSSRWHRVGRCC